VIDLVIQNEFLQLGFLVEVDAVKDCGIFPLEMVKALAHHIYSRYSH
jgi:hypothetical protein